MYHEYLINVREAHIEKFNVKLMFYDMKYFIDLQIEYSANKCDFRTSTRFDLNFLSISFKC